MRIIINTISSKRSASGTFQVSVNFIKKSIEVCSGIEWFYFVSTDIDHEISTILPDSIKDHYHVFATQPTRNLIEHYQVKKSLRKLEDSIKPDFVYTLVAPCYYKFKTPEVMRFTNPWVAHPNDYAWSRLGFKERLRTKLYTRFQWHLLKNAFAFITQTETVKQSLLRNLKLDENRVKVVSNVLPATLKDMSVVSTRSNFSDIHIASIAADYPHKNLDIIPEVLAELRDCYGVDNVVIHLTLSSESKMWKRIEERAKQLGLSKCLVNHGKIPQSDLAAIYRQCTVFFFPSLLEVFSASILEAMYFNLFIVATKLEFNEEVLKEACLYFEPLDYKDAASKIYNILTDSNKQAQLSKKMSERIKLYDNYESYYDETVKFFAILKAIK